MSFTQKVPLEIASAPSISAGGLYFLGVPIADWASVIVIIYTLALFYVLIVREIDRRAEKRLRPKPKDPVPK